MFQLKKKILKFFQNRIDKRNRKRLNPRAEDRTIIANNCIGGFISHYLNLRFCSPTVNLYIHQPDYIKMLQDLDKYFDPDAPITEVKTEKPFPVGDLYGCKIYFMHYTDFESAVKKWRERCARINKNAMYFMMTDRDGCTIEDMKAFDALPYKNKVIFTAKKHPDIASAFCVPGFEGQDSVGQLQESMNILGKRYIDQFDYVDFLNQ